MYFNLAGIVLSISIAASTFPLGYLTPFYHSSPPGDFFLATLPDGTIKDELPDTLVEKKVNKCAQQTYAYPSGRFLKLITLSVRMPNEDKAVNINALQKDKLEKLFIDKINSVWFAADKTDSSACPRPKLTTESFYKLREQINSLGDREHLNIHVEIEIQEDVTPKIAIVSVLQLFWNSRSGQFLHAGGPFIKAIPLNLPDKEMAKLLQDLAQQAIRPPLVVKMEY